MELNKIFAQHKENNASDNIIVKKRNKPTKKDLYKKERQDILNRINTILGINKDNNTIFLYDIENDLNKKTQIFALSDDVKKYFKVGTWGVFCKKECQDNHFLLCKSIYKDMGYEVISKAVDITRDNNKIRTTKYTIGQFNFS